MTDRILRWGLLGTARINSDLIPPLRAAPRHELAAVASRSEARAEAYARQWEIPRAYDSYEALLADPDVDVIYNPLPNSLHAEWTIAAAQAGKHVLCEKPLALTLDEVDAMQAAAEQAGVVVAEAFMYRHQRQTLKIKELVDDGAIGRLRSIYGAFTYNIADEDNVRLVPALGGGSLWDMGCYPVNWSRFLLGAEPVEVHGWQLTGASGVDEMFAAQMRFDGDVYAQFVSGFRAHRRVELEVVGDAGMIRVSDAIRATEHDHVALRRGSETELLTFPTEAVFLGELEDMADAVLLGKSQRVSLADSRKNVATILALLQSAREGRPVTLGA